MDIGRLRTLRELSLRKTMAAVADALLVSPSAVSQQIAQLEEEAGVALIERRGRGVCLTPAGETLVAHAERVMLVLEEAKTDLAAMKRVVGGELRVAAFPSVAATLVPAAMRALDAAHPQLRLALDVLEPLHGLAALRAWQADVALIDDLTLMPGAPPENIEATHILDDRLYVMLPRGHPLTRGEDIGLAALRHERWAMDALTSPYSATIIEACRAAGFEPAINGNCEGFEVVVALVEAGCSISVMPGLRVRSYQGTYVCRKLVPEIRRRIFVAHRRGELRNPAVAAVVQALRDSAEQWAF